MSATKMGAGAETDGASREESERPIPHFTVAERAAKGTAARAEVPRKTHADWEPSPARIDPVELLEEQAKTRVVELVPIRYGRMLVSPFTYFRGAAYVMAADLAGMPRTGLHVQLCGDAHLSNFGAYAAPDRRLVFDTNDFDETLPGPFEWDLKRLVASFSLGLRSVLTTAATATWAGLMGDLSGWSQPSYERIRLAGVLIGLLTGAIAGGLLMVHASDWAPILPLAVSTAVIAVAIRRLHPAAKHGGAASRDPPVDTGGDTIR